MKLKLKVLKGSGAGKEVKIPMPKCLIGRGEDCHMRPKSDAISRHHCVIYVKDGRVIIRDLKSKNGTFVNSKPVEKDRILKTGDKLQIGPLAFELLIDHSLGGDKKPKVKSVKEAAARTTAASQETALLDDSDISDWLDEADETERKQRMDPETRQLKLDETDQMTLQKEIERRAQQRREQSQEPDTKELEDAKNKTAPKKEPGKLPKPPERETKDSGEAAADVLRKFFNSR